MTVILNGLSFLRSAIEGQGNIDEAAVYVLFSWNTMYIDNALPERKGNPSPQIFNREPVQTYLQITMVTKAGLRDSDGLLSAPPNK